MVLNFPSLAFFLCLPFEESWKKKSSCSKFVLAHNGIFSEEKVGIISTIRIAMIGGLIL